jgi:hypothetical protein
MFTISAVFELVHYYLLKNANSCRISSKGTPCEGIYYVYWQRSLSHACKRDKRKIPCAHTRLWIWREFFCEVAIFIWLIFLIWTLVQRFGGCCEPPEEAACQVLSLLVLLVVIKLSSQLDSYCIGQHPTFVSPMPSWFDGHFFGRHFRGTVYLMLLCSLSNRSQAKRRG